MPKFAVLPTDVVGPDFGTPATGAPATPRFGVGLSDISPDFGEEQQSGPGAISRGFVSSLLQENPAAFADALEGVSRLASDREWSFDLRDAADRLRSAAQAPERYQPQSGDLSDLWEHPSVGHALTYLGERFGQAVGSTLPSVAGGVLGALAGGRIAGKPGAAVGGFGGAALPSASLNYGSMYRDFVDEGVKPDVAAKWAAFAALPVTGLDIAPVTGWAQRLAGQGAKREAQRAFAKRIVQEALKGGLAEAVTEGAQQTIQERLAADLTGDDFWTPQRLNNILEATVAGGLAGGAFGGVAGLPRDRIEPSAPPQDVEPSGQPHVSTRRRISLEPLQVEPLPLPAPAAPAALPGQPALALPAPDIAYGEGFTAREPRPGEGYQPPLTPLPAPPPVPLLEGAGTPALPPPDRTYGRGFTVVPTDSSPDFGDVPSRQFRPEPAIPMPAPPSFDVVQVDVEPQFEERPSSGPSRRGGVKGVAPVVEEMPSSGPPRRGHDVTFEDVARSIHQQESGGRATAKTSVTGARGGMQIQPQTFAQYARPGENIDNPADNIAVGRRIIRDLWEKSGGDPARVAVGYFSGPGNISAAGSETPWRRDAADPNGKSTSSYVDDVLRRLGQGRLPAAQYGEDEGPRRPEIPLPEQLPPITLEDLEAVLLPQPEDVGAPATALLEQQLEEPILATEALPAQPVVREAPEIGTVVPPPAAVDQGALKQPDATAAGVGEEIGSSFEETPRQPSAEPWQGGDEDFRRTLQAAADKKFPLTVGTWQQLADRGLARMSKSGKTGFLLPAGRRALAELMKGAETQPPAQQAPAVETTAPTQEPANVVQEAPGVQGRAEEDRGRAGDISGPRRGDLGQQQPQRVEGGEAQEPGAQASEIAPSSDVEVSPGIIETRVGKDQPGQEAGTILAARYEVSAPHEGKPAARRAETQRRFVNALAQARSFLATPEWQKKKSAVYADAGKAGFAGPKVYQNAYFSGWIGEETPKASEKVKSDWFIPGKAGNRRSADYLLESAWEAGKKYRGRNPVPAIRVVLHTSKGASTTYDVKPTEKAFDDLAKRFGTTEKKKLFSLSDTSVKVWKSDTDRTRIAQRVAEIVHQIAPQTNVEVVNDLMVRVGGRDLLGGGQYDPLRNLVTVALNWGDPELTAGHEAIHALRDAGLFTPQEWSVLAKAARDRWIDELGVRDIYENVSDDVIAEEAIAQKFAEWRMQPAKELPAIRRVFAKIRDFFRRLANTLRGMGFRTAEDVFEAAERGEVGRRKRTTEPEAPGAASLFSSEADAVDAAHALSFSEGRGAWVWRDKGGSYHADAAFKPKEGGTLLSRVFGDEVFGEDVIVGEAERANTLAEDVNAVRASFFKQPKQKTGTASQQAAVEAIFGDSSKDPFRQRVRNVVRNYTDRSLLRMKQAILDQYASIKDIERRQRGGVAEGSRSPYKSVRLTRNLHSVMAYVLRHGPLAVEKQRDGGVWFGRDKEWKSGGFEEIFKPIVERGLLDLWKGWAVAVRADRLMSEGRENLMTRQQIDALLPLGKQHPEFVEAHRKWQAFNRRMLDMAQEAGLINADQRALWENSDYIPFFRVLDNEVRGPRGGKSGVAGQRSGIRTLKGGKEKLNDPIENMVMNMTSLVDRSFKNLAMRKVVTLALEAGIMTREKYDWRKTQVTPEEAAQELERIGVQVRGLTKQQHQQVLNFWRMQTPEDPDVVSVMVNGKPQFFRVNDPDLLRSITALTPRQLTGVLSIFRLAKRALTEAITLDPAFMVANAARDTLSAWVTTGQSGFKPFIDSARGFARALRENDPIKLDIMASGGGLSGFYGTAPEDARKYIERHVGRIGVESILDTPRKIVEAWHNVGQASESANRIAIAEAVKKNGGSEAEQAFQAMDLLDFGMRGDSAAVQVLIESIPFLNARMQGLYRLGRGMKNDPKAFLLRGALIAGASLALLAQNWDKEEYEKLPDWDKDTYWHFWISGQHFRFPKPFEVGALFATVPERAARLHFGRDDAKKSWEAAKRMLRDTFAVSPPQLFAPAIEQYANRDAFTGSPIVGLDLERLPPWLQFKPETSETAREAGEALNVSPTRIEHLIGGYFGTMGLYALALADQLIERVGDYPTEPSLRIDDIPVVKRFVRDEPARSTRYLTEFYDLKREVDGTVNAVRELAKRGEMDEARALRQEKRADIAIAPTLNKAAETLSGLRQREQAIMRDRKMSAEEKREKLDSLTEKRNALAKRYVNMRATMRVMQGISRQQ